MRPGVRPGKGPSAEIRLTLLLTLFSFVALGLPRVFTSTGAHTLFLEAYGPKYLSYAYLAEALIVPVFGHIYISAGERFGSRTLLVSSMAIDILALSSIWAAFTFTKLKIIAFFGMVWFETEFVFVSLWLWGMATQLMTLRQGKRLFGYISAGEPIAVILGGMLTPFLLRILAPQYLLLLSAAGVAAGIILVLYITAHFKPQADAADDEDETEVTGASRWYLDKYVQVLVGIVVISQFGYFFTDSAFYIEAGARFPTEIELGAFIGKTMAAVGFVSLVTSLFVSGPLVKRFGLRSALLLLPILLASIALTVSVLGLGFGAAGAVFWMTVLLKVTDQSVRYTVDKTSSVTLYAPLPAAQRRQVQAALESVIEPLVGGVSGLVLALLVQVLGFGAVAVVTIVMMIAVLWTVLVFVQDGYYCKALQAALLARRFGGASLSIDDPAATAVVAQSLEGNEVGGVLNGLELIGRVDGYDLNAVYARLIHHPASEIRADVLRRIAAFEDRRFPLEPIESIIETDRCDEVRGQAVRTIAALDPDHVVDRLEPLLVASELPVRREAFVALLRHGGIEGVLSAGVPLLAALHSKARTDREFAAGVFQGAATPGFNRALSVLLADPEAAVRAAALRATGASGSGAVLRQASRLLEDSGVGVSRTAAKILEQVGEPAIPAVLDVLDDPQAMSHARRSAAKILGSMATKTASVALVDRLSTGDREIAQAVLFAIPTSEAGGEEEAGRSYSNALAKLLPLTFELMAWRVALVALPGRVDAVLIRALDWQFQDDLRAIFRLLTLMHPRARLGDTWRNFAKGNPAQKAIAMEALEIALQNDFRGAVLVLIEHETDAARLNALSPSIRPTECTSTQAISSCAQASKASVKPWVRAAALYTAAALSIDLDRGDAAAITDPVCLEIIQGGLGGGMLTIEKVLVLRNTPIFAGVREEHLVDVAQRADLVELTAGAVLFEKGDEGSSMFVVVDGELRVYAGRQTFATLGPREVVGEMAAVDPEARSASVAATRHTLLLRISNKNIELLIEHDPDVAMGIIKVLCTRLRASNRSPIVEPLLEAAQ